MKKLVLALTIGAACLPLHAEQACSDWGKRGALLHADDFSGTLDKWHSEIAPKPLSGVAIKQDRLVMDVGGGATTWFKQPLAGDLLISYTRKVVMQGGKNDRLSDLNHFWMASDPANPNLFTRSGVFSQYDSLLLYYAGIGGNTNSTSRFRKYDGKGERILLTDLSQKDYLLEPNREYAVQIATYKGCTRVLVDGKVFFSYRDPAPLTKGHFGFRTTQSRHEIDDFKVYRLD